MTKNLSLRFKSRIPLDIFNHPAKFDIGNPTLFGLNEESYPEATCVYSLTLGRSFPKQDIYIPLLATNYMDTISKERKKNIQELLDYSIRGFELLVHGKISEVFSIFPLKGMDRYYEGNISVDKKGYIFSINLQAPSNEHLLRKLS